MEGVNDSVYSLLHGNRLSQRDANHRHQCSVDQNGSVKRKRRNTPVVTWEIDDREVYRRTGFINKTAMLAFIVVIHNGDIEDISSNKISTLTGLEEWFLYLEIVNGMTIMRWVDCGKQYCIREDIAREVFDHKVALINQCHRSWPMYASHAEDRKLRKAKWDE